MWSGGFLGAGGESLSLQLAGFLELGLDFFSHLQVAGDGGGVFLREFLKGRVGASFGVGLEHGEDLRVAFDHGRNIGFVKGGAFEGGELFEDGLVFRVELGREGDLLLGGDFGESGLEFGMTLDHVVAELLDLRIGGVFLGDLAELDLERIYRGDGVCVLLWRHHRAGGRGCAAGGWRGTGGLRRGEEREKGDGGEETESVCFHKTLREIVVGNWPLGKSGEARARRKRMENAGNL